MIRHTNNHDKFAISLGELIWQELCNDRDKNLFIILQKEE